MEGSSAQPFPARYQSKSPDKVDQLSEGTPSYELVERPVNNDHEPWRQRHGAVTSSDVRPRLSLSTSPPSSELDSQEGPAPIALSRAVESPRKPTRLHYRQKFILRGHKKGVSAVKFSPNGRHIASCSADGTIKVWDVKTGKHQQTFEGHLAGVSTIAWSPDSRWIASGSDDKQIRLWDTVTGKAHSVPFTHHSNYVYSLAFSPHGNILASGSYDESVCLWDVRTARVIRSLPAHSDPVGGVDFVRDGTMVASCGWDGLIRIWDTGTGQCLKTLIHEDNSPVSFVRFSPNGKYVLAWTLDSCVRLWNYGENRCVKTYQGHRNEKFSVRGAFGVYETADGDRSDEENGMNGGEDEESQHSPLTSTEEKHAFIGSGSEDGTIVLWDVGSKNVLQTLQEHDGVVLGIDTHPTDKVIASGGVDRTVRIWECHRCKSLANSRNDRQI